MTSTTVSVYSPDSLAAFKEMKRLKAEARAAGVRLPRAYFAAMRQRIDAILSCGFDRENEKDCLDRLDELFYLEDLTIEFIRRLERGDEYDSQVEDIRTWACNRYPDVAGGGEARP